jgi:PPOX class probable F420-dependent enzyme
MPRTTLDARDRELLEAPNYVHVSTLRDDGSIQTVPIWVDVDGEHILLNGEDTRGWARNLRARPQTVTLTVLNMDNPYEYLTVTGQLASETREGAAEHIDKLALKYMGRDTYPDHSPDRPRVIFRVAPERVRRHG